MSNSMLFNDETSEQEVTPSALQVVAQLPEGAYQVEKIQNGVFGGAGPLPSKQNSREGGYFGKFLTATGIQGKQMERYIQLHLDPDDPASHLWTDGLPGGRGRTP